MTRDPSGVIVRSRSLPLMLMALVGVVGNVRRTTGTGRGRITIQTPMAVVAAPMISGTIANAAHRPIDLGAEETLFPTSPRSVRAGASPITNRAVDVS